jgi:NADH:ubiquinone oxidoreductase subunit E
MTYAQAFPKLYRKLKENNITYNSIKLIQKLQKLQEIKGAITDEHIHAIVKQLIK